MSDNITGYKLSRKWFDFCFENPELIKPNHSALYFFAIEHCNRLGWKAKFGFPTEMAKDAIGIKNYRTYINTLSDLIDWGFIKMIEKSKNQYSANIIAIVKNTNATTKALDKATSKHSQKQRQSIDSINKPITVKPNNKYIYSEFYDYQISITTNDDYKRFVKYLFGENMLSQKLDGVLSIKNQLTADEFQAVFDKCKVNKKKIGDILTNIENDKKYYKGKVSLYRTLLNWAGDRFAK